MKYTPHAYQQFCIDYLLTHSAAGLFLKPGMGKTSIALTAADILLYDRFEISKALVIAPLRVAEDTWSRESEKWNHLRHLKISRVLGTVQQRQNALQQDADIYCINRENVPWLVKPVAGKALRTQMAVRTGDRGRAFQFPQSRRKTVSRSAESAPSDKIPLGVDRYTPPPESA